MDDHLLSACGFRLAIRTEKLNESDASSLSRNGADCNHSGGRCGRCAAQTSNSCNLPPGSATGHNAQGEGSLSIRVTMETGPAALCPLISKASPATRKQEVARFP